jgi:hypothetical protein
MYQLPSMSVSEEVAIRVQSVGFTAANWKNPEPFPIVTADIAASSNHYNINITMKL